MPSMVAADAINMEELMRALDLAPGLVHRNVKSEMLRFSRRVRRKVIRERLNGRPGLNGGQFKKGKHVNAFTTGNDLLSLKSVVLVSRVLRIHEEGGVIAGPVAIRLQKGLPIDPRKVPGLFKLPGKPALAVKEGNGIRVLYLLRRGVKIPARLGLQAIWRRELPDGLSKIGVAVQRALREAMDKQMKAVSGFIQRVAA